MKKPSLQLAVIFSFAIYASLHGRILRFYPSVDTLFTAGGCTPTQITTSYVRGVDGIDTLKILPGWNTWFWSDDDLFYDAAGFVIQDSLKQYETELWMQPVDDYDKPLLIPTDSVVWIYAYEFDLQLFLKKDATIIDSLSQFCKARIGIRVKNKEHNLSHFQLATRPNPFNQETTIKYCIPGYRNARIAIYNAKGQLVEVLVDAAHPPGEYSIKWRAENRGSGHYFIVVQTDNSIESAKCLLIK